MPFLMLVHSRDDHGALPERPEGPRPWEPNWRVWRWVAAAVLLGCAASQSQGALATLLVFAAFALCCRALAEAIPYRDGLREWRQ